MSTQELKPLSIPRVQELFDKHGWRYDILEGGKTLATGFSGIGMQIRSFEPALAIVSTVALDSLDLNRFDDVLQWVERYNNFNAYPSATALKDPEHNRAMLGVNYSLPRSWDYSDEQFEAHISSGIEGVVNASRDFLGEFAPEVLKQIDQELG